METKRKRRMEKRKADTESSTSPQRNKLAKVDKSAGAEFDVLRQLMQAAPEDVGNIDAEFEAHFEKIATYLMNSAAMDVNGHRFRLVEIEFYLTGGAHPDPFTHCDEDQKTCGEWYFHKQNGKAYKSGTYKGLDLTFGAPNKCHGGILIRAIQSSNDHTSKIIEGPCMVVNKILELAKAESIEELVGRKNYTHSVYPEDSILRLVPETQKHVVPILKSPRVGLTLKNPTKPRIQYLMKDYRYLNVPDQMQKGKIFIILSLYENKYSAEKISQVTKTKIPVVQKYIDFYEKNKHGVSYFGGKSLDGVEDLCSIFSALRKNK